MVREGSDAPFLEPQVRGSSDSKTKGTEGNITLCVQRITSVIYRALHKSVERTKSVEPTSRILVRTRGR